MKFHYKKDESDNRAKSGILVLVALTFAGLLATGMPCAAQTVSLGGTHRIYDNFNEKWIDPAKWLTGAPGCWGLSLECVREIREGKLHLEARNIGGSDANSNVQWSQSDLFFPAANSIASITADATVVGTSGANCPLNPEAAGAQVRLGGSFFNSGSGNPSDDLYAYVIANHNDQAGSYVDYGIYWGWENQSQWVHIADFSIGTPVTMTIRWDQPNHCFVAILIGPSGQALVGESSYKVSDSTPAANPSKSLSAATYAPNCTVQMTTSNVEASFDNVIINQ